MNSINDIFFIQSFFFTLLSIPFALLTVILLRFIKNPPEDKKISRSVAFALAYGGLVLFIIFSIGYIAIPSELIFS
jgi:hypothetical protein